MKKNLDKEGRFRGVIVAFRMSKVESDELNTRVAFSGLNKQDYLISKVLERGITVYPNVRILKALEIEIRELNVMLNELGTKYFNDDSKYKLESVIDILNVMAQEEKHTIG